MKRGFNPSFCFHANYEMSDLTKVIGDWVSDYVGDGPVLLVDLQISIGLKRTLISILVDTEEGITIDACALMSRKLAHFIEEQELIPEAFNLEVSSPGLDYPLTHAWQYKKNTGRKVKIWMKEGDTLEGTFISFTDADVEILTEKTVKHRKVVAKEPSRFNLADIDKIKVQVSF